MRVKFQILAITLASLLSTNVHAWFFIFPIPNLAKPGPLQITIDALEKSTETRALAFVSEDKAFGAKYWVWGKYSGEVSQETADRYALDQCESSLRNAKAKTEGGQSLYNFGDKKCELHPFTPNDGPMNAEAKRKAAEEQQKQLAAIEEAKRVAAEEETKRKAAEAESQRVAAEQEQLRIAAEEEAKRTKTGEAKKSKVSDISRQPSVKSSVSTQVDFDAEANKAARILGCQPAQVKVTGAEGSNIQYKVDCADSRMLNLSCDRSGLCLQKRPAASSKQ